MTTSGFEFTTNEDFEKEWRAQFVSVALRQEINLSQFAQELRTRSGISDAEIFQENGKIFAKSPVTETDILSALDAHVPDPWWGRTSEERINAELLHKLSETNDLSRAEMCNLLRLALNIRVLP